MSKKQTTLFQSWGKPKKEAPKTYISGSSTTDRCNDTNQPSARTSDDQVIDLCFDEDDEEDDILFEAEDTVLHPDLSHDDKQESRSDEETAVCDISIGAAADNLTNTQGQTCGLPGFDKSAGQRWIYPTNYPVREYQFNIVQQALFKNTMVTLPTGLGKTFIAAVVMYNFYRWYPQGKVIFMAPTKPLVAQQIEACYNIMGIPQHHTAEMTGSMGPPKREKAWHDKRVFFLTPQVLTNDLSRGSCPAKLVKCVVIDEAHKALGNHAYCQVVRELVKYTESFRVLSLSATPGSDLKAVQQVLTNLLISQIEIRTEESPDIRSYSHERKVDKVVVPLGQELSKVKDIYIHIMDVVVSRLKHHGVIYNRDTTSLSKFLILKSREAFRQNPPEQLPRNQYGVVEGDFALAMSLYHGYDLLQLHGSRSLFNYLEGIVSGDKAYGRTRTELGKNADFTQLMSDLAHKYRVTQSQSSKPFVTGHPKMEKLQEIVLEHFSKHKDTTTRVMIFSQFRDSVQEITDMLHVHHPVVKVMSFIGQASAGKTTKGFTQKEQLKVMKQFREGGYNTLVSTCVGEEGLDIGDVDLIICFDAHKSPIRLVQRMGRTGRKREGRIVMLVTQGKEEQIYNQSQYSKKTIHKAILNGARSLHFYQHSPRMVPESCQPTVHKMFITVKETFKPTKKISTEKTGAPGKITKVASVSKADADDADSDILTLNEYREVKTLLGPDMDTPVLPGNQLICLDHNTVTNQAEAADRFLSLSDWTSWQTTLQQTERVDHSLGSKHLVEMMEFIQLQQTLPAEEDPYHQEMAAYLDEDDLLQPGEANKCLPSRLLSEPSKKYKHVSKNKKRYSDALPRLELLDEADGTDSGEELPPFDTGNQGAGVPVIGVNEGDDEYVKDVDLDEVRESDASRATKTCMFRKAVGKLRQNSGGIEKRSASKSGNATAVERTGKRTSIQSNARLMEIKMNESKVRRQKNIRRSTGQRSIIQLLGDSDSNDFDTVLPSDVSKVNEGISEEVIEGRKLSKELDDMSQGNRCIVLEEDEEDKLYMVRTPPSVDAAVEDCEGLSANCAANVNIEDIIKEWQQENENGKYIILSKSRSQKWENSFAFDDQLLNKHLTCSVSATLVNNSFSTKNDTPIPETEDNAVTHDLEAFEGLNSNQGHFNDDTPTVNDVRTGESVKRHLLETSINANDFEDLSADVQEISENAADVEDCFSEIGTGMFDVGGDILLSDDTDEDDEDIDKAKTVKDVEFFGEAFCDGDKAKVAKPVELKKSCSTVIKENGDEKPDMMTSFSKSKRSSKISDFKDISLGFDLSDSEDWDVADTKTAAFVSSSYTQVTFTQAMACVHKGSTGSHSEASLPEDQNLNEVIENTPVPVKSNTVLNKEKRGKGNKFEGMSKILSDVSNLQSNLNEDLDDSTEKDSERKISEGAVAEPHIDTTAFSELLFDDEFENTNLYEKHIPENDGDVGNGSVEKRSLKEKNGSSGSDSLELPQFDLGFDVDEDIIPPSPNASESLSQTSTCSVISQSIPKRLSQGVFFGLNVSKANASLSNSVDALDKTEITSKSAKCTTLARKSLKSKRSLDMEIQSTNMKRNNSCNINDTKTTAKKSLDPIPENEDASFSERGKSVVKQYPSELESDQCKEQTKTDQHTSIIPVVCQKSSALSPNAQMDDITEPRVEDELDNELCFNLLDNSLDEWVNSGLDAEHKDGGSDSPEDIEIEKESPAVQSVPPLNVSSSQSTKNLGARKNIHETAGGSGRNSCEDDTSVFNRDTNRSLVDNERDFSQQQKQNRTSTKKVNGRKSTFSVDQLSPDSMDDFSFDIPKLHLKLPDEQVSPPPALSPCLTSVQSPTVTPKKPISAVLPFNVRESSTPLVNQAAGRRKSQNTPNIEKITRFKDDLDTTGQGDDSFIVRRRKKSSVIHSPNTSTESLKDEQERIQASQGFDDSLCRVRRKSGSKRQIVISSDEEENETNQQDKNFDDDFNDSFLMLNNDYLAIKKKDLSKVSSANTSDLTERSVHSISSKSSSNASKTVSFLDDDDDDDDKGAFINSAVCKRVKTNTTSNGKGLKFGKKKKKISNPFLEDEAELSEDGHECSDDEEEHSDLDAYEGSFIANSQFSQTEQLNETDVRAMYMKSVRSPVHQQGRFKLQYDYKHMDVFSQVPRDNGEKSQYMEDSFCVGSEDEYEAEDEWLLGDDSKHDASEVTVMSPDVTILKTGRKRRKGTMTMQTGRQRALHFGRMRALDEIKAKLAGKNTKKDDMEEDSDRRENEVSKKGLTKKRRIQVLENSSSDERNMENTSMNSPKIQVGCMRKKARLLLSSSDDEGDFENNVNVSSIRKGPEGLVAKSRGSVPRNNTYVANKVENVKTDCQSRDVYFENDRQERLRRQRLRQQEFRKELEERKKMTESDAPVIDEIADKLTKIKERPGANKTETSAEDVNLMSLQKPEATGAAPVVLVDSKEVSGSQDIISDLRFKHGVHVSAAQLPGCDYIVSNRMAVERKQWSEFCNGTNRAKLVERLQHLAQLYDRTYLVVEKDRVKPGEEKSAKPIHWTKYIDRTIALLHRSGHKVLFTDTQGETSQLLADLARVEQRKDMSINVPVEITEDKVNRIKFYVSLPKLSYIHALNLCDGFRSVSDFLKGSVALIEKRGKMSRNRALEVHSYIQRMFDSNMLPTKFK